MIVNRKRNYTLHFLLLAVMVSVALGCVNYLSMEHRARLDLTGDGRFTLSEGTQRLFDSLTEPVVVTYYVDEEPPPKRINLERDVRDKLQELAATSGGKLAWSIDRITNATARSRQEDLEKKGIQPHQDFLTTGTDDAATVRGFQGYFTSLEVRYGLAEPVVINGIVNLVDKSDEGLDHRVDTLEFDICFAILRMRSQFTRGPIRRMVRASSQPIKFTLHVSEQMPAKNARLGATLYEALNALKEESGGNVSVERIVIPWNNQIREAGIFLSRMTMQTEEETVDPADESRKGNKYYYSIVQIQFGDRTGPPIYDFRDQASVESVLSKLEEPLYELMHPRTKLGFVLPPSEPAHGESPMPGEPPPRGPYTPLFGYVRQQLRYQAVWVDLLNQRRIPGDLACLMVFEPNRLSERELYEIDRYLAEGGNVIMFYQGWETKLNMTGPRRFPERLSLTKVETKTHFVDWAEELGIEFGQDLLLDKGGMLAPYRQSMHGGIDVMPTTLPLAAIVEARDINNDSVFSRRLQGMPLPLPVAVTIDASKVEAAGLERVDIVTLRDDIYRFIPANPSFPEVPLSLSLDSKAEVQQDPAAEPGTEIRAQRVDGLVLIASGLQGTFPSYFARQGRVVPAWESPPPDGDPLAGHEPPPLKARPGARVVCGSAGTLNIEYLPGYGLSYAQTVAIPSGVAYFRNLAEAFIYGEDLVRLRARTGIAPRIGGEVSDQKRMFWLIMCIGGMPLILMLAGLGRALFRARAQQQFDAITGTGASS